MDRVNNLLWLFQTRAGSEADLAAIALRLFATDLNTFDRLVAAHRAHVDHEDNYNAEKKFTDRLSHYFFVPQCGRIEMTQTDIDRLAAIYDHSHRWVATIKHAREHLFPNGANGNGALYTAKYVCEYLRDQGLIPDRRIREERY